ncbi:MAG: CehA/McbA family metallohydrolase [Clostridia bacterium]
MASFVFERLITKAEERQYFTIPFTVPEGIESMVLRYTYARHVKSEQYGFVFDEERSIIDLGLNMPGGVFVGASGSDRTAITISPFGSSHGYESVDILPGEWEIIVGAYKVPPEGTKVVYEIELAPKVMRRFKGDLHTHTTGSDGVLTPEELALLCRGQGLDFVFVTNHNTWFENDHLPRMSDLTMIPGMEWTHYRGHTNFLGVRKPCENPFCVNTAEEARAVIAEAKAAGALITFNHPFCKPECGWTWGMDIFPMDAVEIWNGALMMGPNEDCLNWWHSELCSGRKLPAVGGSDFHREGPLALPGLPTTCVYALSRSPHDIMAALVAGCCYVSYSPAGPDVKLSAGDVQMGGTAAQGASVMIKLTHIKGGDMVRIITDRAVSEVCCPPGAVEIMLPFRAAGERFVRCEVLRSLAPSVPITRVLVSNPIYFSPEK